jgi:predicted DNA-binding transcriptional regulator
MLANDRLAEETVARSSLLKDAQALLVERGFVMRLAEKGWLSICIASTSSHEQLSS